MNSKVDIFASPKQHSLFPMAVSCQDVSKEDYHLFYQHERRLFSLLIKALHREVVQSILVLGFILWLEREGYSSKNLAHTIVDSLSLSAIDLVIDEVVICLNCKEKKGKNLVFEGSNTGHHILLLKNLLDRKMICLRELHENRDEIFKEVSSIAKHVCGKAFVDILHQFMGRNTPSTMVPPTPSTMVPPTEVVTGFVVGGSRYLAPCSPQYDITNYIGLYRELVLGIHQDRSLFGFGNVNCAFDKFKDLSINVPLGIGEQEQEVSRDDRTIFLTFSKGYPISEKEVKDYFTSYFGDFIEEIYMHDVGPDEQPLYARIVTYSPMMVKVIVERDNPIGKSKYNINGKHVWARKYVKKKPIRASQTQLVTGEVIAPPQP